MIDNSTYQTVVANHVERVRQAWERGERNTLTIVVSGFKRACAVDGAELSDWHFGAGLHDAVMERGGLLPK